MHTHTYTKVHVCIGRTVDINSVDGKHKNIFSFVEVDHIVDSVLNKMLNFILCKLSSGERDKLKQC